MTDPRDQARVAESKRILDRISQEESLIGRATGGVRRHVTAKDEQASDAIELWGTRIGRSLALLITVGVFAWLLWVLLGR